MYDFIDLYPNEASGGEKQRIALARALILKPEFILLDEITSALDVEQSAKVLECLEILKERGIGIFLITHLINFARQSADQVLFMDKGQIKEKGDASILQAPKTDRMQEFLSLVENIS
ncbi:MAG: amino acid ABC transporter ATP-binding protein [Proteobacteria bacterium]|nr:amino acid ABC transporter ATP-binding protein [Pseudomonadota bacterium]